jgi:N-acetylmuramoyl-L-alanine amidase
LSAVPPGAPPWAPSISKSNAAARPLTGARIRTIVLDPGHGGKDPGARGPDGLREKDVCLDIALRLRQEIAQRDPGLRVVLTRDRDDFISLQERTAIANRDKGDLFVSIHNNASPDGDVHGTQVFFFDSQSSDRAASDLSMRENGEANQLDVLMTDLAKSIVRDQSIGFASLVQRAMGRTINLKHRDISYAPFYVLARTEMPAILVEVAFITNPREERLLGDPGFRQRAAASIATGIESYARLVEGPRTDPN